PALVLSFAVVGAQEDQLARTFDVGHTRALGPPGLCLYDLKCEGLADRAARLRDQPRRATGFAAHELFSELFFLGVVRVGISQSESRETDARHGDQWADQAASITHR